MRDRHRLASSSGGGRAVAGNQGSANSFSKLKTAAIYMVIMVLLGLSLSQMLDHHRSIGNCNLKSIKLDANGDGALTYRDVGDITLGLFEIPAKLSSANETVKPLATFLELKKESCSGWISVIFNGISWLLSLSFLNLLVSSMAYGLRRLFKLVLFDAIKLSPFPKFNAKVFRILCSKFSLLVLPRYLILLVAGVTVISLLASRNMSTTVAVGTKGKSLPKTVSAMTSLPNTVSKFKTLEKLKSQASSNLYRDHLPEFKKIDVLVASVSASQYLNVDALAKELTQGLDSELQKTYSIYRWVAQNIEYDTDAYFSNNLRGIGSASVVLKNRKAVCDGYSELMMKLGHAAGLKIEKISGYAKGYGYAVGNTHAKSNHAWNAVKIDDSWYLLDSTWDAGSVNRETRKFVKKNDDFNYFLTSPGIFIYNHYPELNKWQLLEREWDREEFFSKVGANEKAFRLGLDIGNNSNATVTIDSTPYIFDFRTSAQMTGNLATPSGKVPGNWSLTVFDTDGKSKLLVSAPSKGSYDLLLFGKGENGSGGFMSLLEYKLIVNDVSRNADGFPTTYGRYSLNKVVLKSPMNGRLPAHEPVHFKLGATEARKVVLYQHGKPIHTLSQEDGFFVGTVTMSEGDVTVFAEFNDANKLEGLLKYQVR